MPNIITSPVELGFSEFVSKLVSDTFDAVISSTITQEENWNQLNQLLSLAPDEFASQVIDDEMVSVDLITRFPDGSGGTAIVKDAKYIRANPGKGIAENPPVKTLLGYVPHSNRFSEKDIAEIKRIIRIRLAEKKYDILNRMLSKGQTRIIVDAGKINAKLNFEILQVEESNDELAETESKRVFIKQKYPGFTSLGRPVEMKKIHLFVKPPADKDPQTHQLKANVYGEVELQFKTIS